VGGLGTQEEVNVIAHQRVAVAGKGPALLQIRQGLEERPIVPSFSSAFRRAESS
jgi:hypothetical protein